MKMFDKYIGFIKIAMVISFMALHALSLYLEAILISKFYKKGYVDFEKEI